MRRALAHTPDPQSGGLIVRTARPSAPGVTVVGYISAATGVGEAARGTIQALQSCAYPVAAVNLAGADQGDGTSPGGRLPAPMGYRVNLFHLNAVNMPEAWSRLGASFFTRKTNIGYWFWEMATFPEEWRVHFSHLDELWAASSYVQSTLAGLAPVPVVRMRPAVVPAPPNGMSRTDLGLPAKRFLFLFAFDMLSIPQRKNPFGLIEAYRRAFGPSSSDTLLVIKVNNCDRAIAHSAQLGLEPGLMQRLASAVHGVSGVLLDARFDRPTVSALLSQCDCYVSLHRAEGFGLSIAEAMYFGKPCIATAYSANLDFMTPANSYLADYRPIELERDWGPYRAGWVWAEPDIDHAADLMRQVYTRRDESAVRGAQAAADIRRWYSPAVVGREMIARLALLAER